MSERPAKRARGSYSKLICFRCRERRIKCILSNDGTVKPSTAPQPPDKACQRCQQQGLECIVRKTTLGRPSQKRSVLLTPPTTAEHQHDSTRSPSPCAEDLVLLALNDDEGRSSKRAHSLRERPTGIQLVAVVFKTFDLTSQLLARDKRFGNSIAEMKSAVPPKVEEIIDQELAEILDEHLVWHRLYMPWLPNLVSLHKEICHSDSESGSSLSADLLLALLASIALDVPSTRISPQQRDLQRDLRCIIYHAGQKVLFTLPRHQHTLDALELVHEHRPLALIDSQEAVAHTLCGKLYLTLIDAMAYQLGLDSAPAKLRHCLDANRSDNIPELVLDTLRWCSTNIMFHLKLDVEEAEGTRADGDQLELELNRALDAVASAIDRGLVSTEPFFLSHTLRCRADIFATTRDLTRHWKHPKKLSSIIHEYAELQRQRKTHFDQGLAQLFYSRGRTEEALALSQLSDMELNQGRTNVIGLALFFAIVSGGPKGEDGHNPMIRLSKYYSEALNQKILNKDKCDVWEFLRQFGDEHMDGLERRLTDFINAATEFRLCGVPFVGSPRQTTKNILFACKEIAENNAVRIRLDGELHHRVDMQLILFQEAARQLESMEADGGSQEAVARGSIFAASAKLVRSLHRIMSQWKRSYRSKQQLQQDGQTWEPGRKASTSAWDISLSSYGGIFADGFLNEWDNWPQIDTAELSSLFADGF